MKIIAIIVSPIDWDNDIVNIELSGYVEEDIQKLKLVKTVSGLKDTMDIIKQQEVRYIVVVNRHDLSELNKHFGQNIFDL